LNIDQTIFIARLSICGPTFSLCSVLPMKSWKVYKLLLNVKVLEELFEGLTDSTGPCI